MTRKRLLAAKLEVTAGTAIALAASDATYNIYDHNYVHEGNAEALEAQNAGGYHNVTVLGQSARYTFRTKSYAASTQTNPDWSIFLNTCGMAVSTRTWTPTLGDVTTTTLGYYVGTEASPVFKRIAGAVGTFTIDMTPGQAWDFNWDFVGKRVAPTTTTALTPTFNTTLPLRWINDASTIGNQALKVARARFDLGAQIHLIQDAADATTGFSHAQVSQFTPSLEIVVKKDASLDWAAAYYDHTELAATFICTNGTRTITLSVPRGRLMADPAEELIDNIVHDVLTIAPLNNTDSATDFATIVFN